MNNNKTKKKIITIVCATAVIVFACLYIFRIQSIANIMSISQANVSSTSIIIFKAEAGGDFTKVFASKDASDANKFLELMSSIKTRLCEWEPLTSDHPILEGINYAFMIDKSCDKHMTLDYANGYVYCNNCTYSVSSEDINPLTEGLSTLCS